MSVQAVPRGPLSLTFAGLRERLQIAFPANLFGFGVMPLKISTNDWTQLVRRLPFVGLGWHGIDQNGNGGAEFSGQSKWSVFLAVANARSLEARYLGDETAPGLMQLVEAGVAVMNGFKIIRMDGGGKPKLVGTVMVNKVTNAYAEGWNRDDVAIAAIDLTVGLELSARDLVGPEATADVLSNIVAGWSFAPDPSVQTTETIEFQQEGS